MSDQQTDMNLTMSNTKKEMLAAYNDMKRKLKETRSELSNAETTQEKLKTQAAVLEADRVVAESPGNQLRDLKQRFARELNELATQFEEAVDRYTQVNKAIETKQQELQTMFDVEGAALDLSALIEAHKQKTAELHCQQEEVRARFEAEMEDRKEVWRKEKELHDRGVQEERSRLGKEREREQEDYEYQLNREREQKRNALNDELAQLENEIQSQRSEFEAYRSGKQQELDQREASISEREQRIDQLQSQVEAFPAQKAAAVEEAVQQVRERVESDAARNEELNRRIFEGEKNVLLSKIESLEGQVASQLEHIRILEERQSHAYQQVQEIASQAVASAKSPTYVSPPPSPSQDRDRDSTN